MHQTVEQRIIIFQLQQNARFIDRHQILRRILFRQMKFFNDFHRHFYIRKKLIHNRLFQLKNMFFKDQFFTFQKNPHKIPVTV